MAEEWAQSRTTWGSSQYMGSHGQSEITTLPGRLTAVGWVDLLGYQMLVHFGLSGTWSISHCVCFWYDFTFEAFVVNQDLPYFISRAGRRGLYSSMITTLDATGT